MLFYTIEDTYPYFPFPNIHACSVWRLAIPGICSAALLPGLRRGSPRNWSRSSLRRKQTPDLSKQLIPVLIQIRGVAQCIPRNLVQYILLVTRGIQIAIFAPDQLVDNDRLALLRHRRETKLFLLDLLHALLFGIRVRAVLGVFLRGGGHGDLLLGGREGYEVAFHHTGGHIWRPAEGVLVAFGKQLQSVFEHALEVVGGDGGAALAELEVRLAGHGVWREWHRGDLLLVVLLEESEFVGRAGGFNAFFYVLSLLLIVVLCAPVVAAGEDAFLARRAGGVSLGAVVWWALSGSEGAAGGLGEGTFAPWGVVAAHLGAAVVSYAHGTGVDGS